MSDNKIRIYVDIRGDGGVLADRLVKDGYDIIEFVPLRKKPDSEPSEPRRLGRRHKIRCSRSSDGGLVLHDTEKIQV